MDPTYDLIIVGGGIVGAATAWKASESMPGKKILLIEKESKPASHQTGRNSGVIHAGVYYQPGSLKAKYCKAGLQATIAFCKQYNLPYLQCGKLIVATDIVEQERLEALYSRCQQNELDIERLSAQSIRDREPNIVGKDAILVKDTGITDYQKITERMLGLFQDNGGQVIYDNEVQGLEELTDSVTVTTQVASFSTRFLINCAGLMSDRLIRMMDLDADFQIIPIKGEYFRLAPRFNQIVNHLIYPVPDPAMPFLGVHLTRMIDGSVTVGPNAVLALGREGYGKLEVNGQDVRELMGFSGFWKVIWKHKNSAFSELKNSLSKSGYLKLVQKYSPKVTLEDLLPYPSGIRAQAVSRYGQLIHDFKFVESERSLHIGNAPSPAATSAMPIADAVLANVLQKLD